MKSYSKNNLSSSIPIGLLFIFISSLLIIPNPVGERLKLVTKLNLLIIIMKILDIVLKFGFISLIILSLIYLNLVKSKNIETRVLLNLLMIMLVSSQLTQSQFAHHQAITFFICLFYMLQKKIKMKHE